MAGVISLVAKLNATHGQFRAQFSPNDLRVVQDNIGAHAPVLSIGTSAETVSVGDVGTLGWAIFQNLDGTNYVDVGPDSGGSLVPFLRLEPGEWAVLRLKPGITIKAQANTAAVKLQVMIFED